MGAKNSFLNQVVRATPTQLAKILAEANQQRELWLREYLGDQRFVELSELASSVVSSIDLQASDDRGGFSWSGSSAQSGNVRRDRDRVIILPGIMGSELSLVDPRRLVWIHQLRLFLGGFDWLRLNDSGLARHNSGRDISASGLLPLYTKMSLRLLCSGWDVQTFPYDWRLSVTQNGKLLAALLKQSSPGSRVHLIAHSMGGLVARVALAQIKGDSNRDPLYGGRFIMLGTPNRGSYNAPQIFAGKNLSVKTLVDGLTEPIGGIDLRDRSEVERNVLTVIRSFPGVHDLMPARSHATESIMYDPNSYGSVGPSTRHLKATEQFQEALESDELRYALSANTVYIAGDQQPTIVGFQGKMSEEKYFINRDGDDTVPHRLGLLRGVKTYRVVETHGKLPENDQVLDAIEQLLTRNDRQLSLEAMSQSEVEAYITPPSSTRGGVRNLDLDDAHEEFDERRKLMEVQLAAQISRREINRSRSATVKERIINPDYDEIEWETDPVTMTALTGGMMDLRNTRQTTGSSAPIITMEKKPYSSDLTEPFEPAPVVLIRLIHEKVESFCSAENLPKVDVIAVGLQQGAELAGAGEALDKHLSSLMGMPSEQTFLSLALKRRVFQGQLGSLFYVPNPGDYAEIVITGMGLPGRFYAPELTVMVRQLIWSITSLKRKHLRTVMIGHRSSKSGDQDSMISWMRGIGLAIRDSGIQKNSTSNLPILTVTFAEYYHKRFQEIRAAIENLCDTTTLECEHEGTRFRFIIEPSTSDSEKQSEANATLNERDESTRISVTYNNGIYQFSAQSSNASIPVRTINLDDTFIDQLNNQMPAAPDLKEQAYRGDALTGTIVPRDFRQLIFGSSSVIFQVNTKTARVHWEMLSQRLSDFFDDFSKQSSREDLAKAVDAAKSRFLAFKATVSRQFETVYAPVMEPVLDNKRTLRMLVIADPADHMPLKGAREEAFQIKKLISAFNQVSKTRIELETLIGPREANISEVMAKLHSSEFDILHFAGHCQFVENEPRKSGWIFGKDLVVSAGALDGLDRFPRFVFSNACESGVTPDRLDQRNAMLPPSFAEAFFQKGVANFICTGWRINDYAARVFALEVYRCLFGMLKPKDSDNLMSMGGAIKEARLKLLDGSRGSMQTWGAYQHYGDPRTRLFLEKVSYYLATFNSPLSAKPNQQSEGPDFADPDLNWTASNAKELQAALDERMRALEGTGVVKLTLGYEIQNDNFTDQPAVLAFIEPGTKPDLESTFEGLPVVRVPASPRQLLRRKDRAWAEYLPAEEDWLMPGSSTNITPDLVEARGKITVDYEGPDNVELKQVHRKMTATFCVSPERGFPVLEEFLSGTQEELVIGMYDFSAKHVLSCLTRLSKETRVKLILGPNVHLQGKENDINEEEIRDALKRRFGENFEFCWAGVKSSGRVTGSIFPSAYHIKVVVRDRSAFWLSSGNWQSSNQPPDAIYETNLREAYRHHNREWHVVIEEEGLADIFHRHLSHDFEAALPLQESTRGEQIELPSLPDFFVQEEDDDRAVDEVKLFETETLTARLKVTPVLTPDNFLKEMTALVKSAQKKLYIQNQYIKVKQNISEGFRELLDAVKERIDAGVEVKIILRDNDVYEMLAALKADGFDTGCFRILSRTHTKGVIVDGRKVAVGSHNWSDDGVRRNRDATLIFENTSAAKYFEQIFLYDWQRGRPPLQSRTFRLASQRATETIEGFRRVTISEIFADEE